MSFIGSNSRDGDDLRGFTKNVEFMWMVSFYELLKVQ